jgi:hypothetical protein
MFNQFLATLDNNPSAPANFCWPVFTARTISAAEAYVRASVLGSGSRETLFLRGLQLTDLVAESPLAPYITQADQRLTYNKQTIRKIFRNSGIVVQDTTSGGSPATLSVILQPSAPESGSWDLLMTDSTHLQVTDDQGNTNTTVIVFSGGISNVVNAPGGNMSFVFNNAAPTSGNTWDVSYQAPGFSWVSRALVQSQTIEPQAIMTPDVLNWYLSAPTALDRLAAIVTALGTAGG